MTIYARSDINSVHDATPGHHHVRPSKKDGTLVPVWGIDCSPCELKLQGDPGWHRSRFKIPLTPDEQEEARDAKAAAEAALHQQQLLMAQSALNAQMAQRGAEPQIDPDDVAITSGSQDQSASKDMIPEPVGSEADYSALSKDVLKDLARDRGLPVSGSKDDLISRLAGS